LVCVASPLSKQHFRVIEKIGWLGIRLMCLIDATCLHTDCCSSDLALYKKILKLSLLV